VVEDVNKGKRNKKSGIAGREKNLERGTPLTEGRSRGLYTCPPLQFYTISTKTAPWIPRKAALLCPSLAAHCPETTAAKQPYLRERAALPTLGSLCLEKDTK